MKGADGGYGVHVPGAGPLDARIVAIGEAPAREECAWMPPTPFVGMAGRRLTEWLERVGLRRTELRIENLIEYRVPADKMDKVPREHVMPWITHLHQRVAALADPWVLVPMGNYALYALTGKGKVSWHQRDGKHARPGIKAWRGSILAYTDQRGRTMKVIPTVHPSLTLFREPTLEGVCIQDWQRIVREAQVRELRLPEREHVIRPTLEMVREVRDAVLALDPATEALAVDIERPAGTLPTYTKTGKLSKVRKKSYLAGEVVSVQVAWSPWWSLTIPTTATYWGDAETAAQVWGLIRELLESPVPKVFHHGHFDCWHLMDNGVDIERITWLWDTMYTSHALNPSARHALEFRASVDTRQPFFKAESKSPTEQSSYYDDLEQFWIYGGKDACIPRELLDADIPRLEQRGLMPFYQAHYRDLFLPILRMMRRGMRVDEDLRARRAADIQQQLDALEQRITDLTGTRLHAKKKISGDKLKHHLYNVLRLPVQFKKREDHTKTPTTDEVAIRRLHLQHPDVLTKDVADAILEDQALRKRLEFYDAKRVDEDGRFRSAFGMDTEAGRLNSKKNPRGSGGNAQNIKRDIRDLYLADEGCVMVRVDGSQCENRICAAYIYSLTKDEEMLWRARARPTEWDEHSTNTERIFGVTKAAYTQEHGEQAWKELRYLGKRAVHGCVDGQTEILTERGWVPMPALTSWDRVAQWWLGTQYIEFAQPTRLIEAPYEGPMYRYRSAKFSQYLTPEHRMPYRSNGTFKVTTAQVPVKNARVPIAGYYTGNVYVPAALARLIVAAQADASITASGGLRWHLKKPRKIERLELLLQEAMIPYTKVQGEQTWHIKVKAGHAKDIRYWIPQKRFGASLLKWEAESLDVFLNELPQWDGSESRWGCVYRTGIRENAEWVQIIAHLRGWQSLLREKAAGPSSYGHKPQYHVSFNSQQFVVLPKPHKTSEWKGRIYCVQVPSGFFVMRRNGEVSITGNSQRDMQGETLSDRLLKEGYVKTPQECDALLKAAKAAMPGLEDAYFPWVRALIMEQRYLDSEWGGRLWFTWERLTAEVYRRGYSFLLQDGCGRWMLQWGFKPLDAWCQQHQREAHPPGVNAEIHDEVVWSVPPHLAWESAQLVVGSLERPRTYNGVELTIPCEVTVSARLGGGISWKALPTRDEFEQAVHTVMKEAKA